MARVAFKQADLARALRAARDSGGGWRVRIEAATGDIVADPLDAQVVKGPDTLSIKGRIPWTEFDAVKVP